MRLRFTVRRLMLAVAFAALAFLAVIWQQKSARHRLIASNYAIREVNNRKIAATQGELIRGRSRLIASTERLLAGPEGRDPRKAATYRDDLAREQATLAANQLEDELIGRKLRHFAEMRQKHERIARFPWLPVSPDPPEPSESRPTPSRR